MIFFTSDTHFDSPALVSGDERYSKFKDDKDLNETIICNWNSVVKPCDTVWHLGDFGKAEDGRAKNLLNIIEKLNGNICLVAGNHDPNNIWPVRKRLGCYTEYKELAVDIDGTSQKIVLFHYSMRSWHHSYKGSWHLFGHSHGKMPSYFKSFDVGCMNFKWTPVSLVEVSQKMSQLDSFPFVEGSDLE